MSHGTLSNSRILSIVIIVIFTLFMFPYLGCDSDEALPTLKVTSLAFTDGDILPRRHACDGYGQSPVINIFDAPKETIQFALIMENLDSTSEVSIHWLVWGIDKSGYIPANLHPDSPIDYDIFQGTTDAGNIGYLPPCPPDGETQRYKFTVYALDIHLTDLDESANYQTLYGKLKNHIIAQGSIIAEYY